MGVEDIKQMIADQIEMAGDEASDAITELDVALDLAGEEQLDRLIKELQSAINYLDVAKSIAEVALSNTQKWREAYEWN